MACSESGHGEGKSIVCKEGKTWLSRVLMSASMCGMHSGVDGFCFGAASAQGLDARISQSAEALPVRGGQSAGKRHAQSDHNLALIHRRF